MGPIVAKAVVDWFRVAANKKLVAGLIKRVQIEKVKIQIGSNGSSGSGSTSEGVFAGKSFVFTGSMPTLDRDAAQEMVRERGGDVSSSVSKNTTYVVAGESAGSKLDKARSLGVEIIDEETFKKML